MTRKRLMTTAGGTILCALGIGYFMQAGTSGPNTLVAPQPAPIQQAVIAPAVAAPDAAGEPELDLSAISLTSTQPDIRAPKPMPVPELEGGNLSRPGAGKDGEDCLVTASAALTRMASVDLRIQAPCHGGERVTIHHSGMMFTEITGPDGALSVTVPALSEKAVFIVAFGNGKGAVATVQVPDLASVERVVLQWRGDTGFELHAREFGAAYGESGHVWHGADPRPAGSGGTLARLGDPAALEPQMADIYSFPAGASSREGSVALSVEAEVTARNCGRDITAQSLEVRGPNGLRTRDIELAMPNCADLGDFLVLNNLMDDLKIAAR